MDVLLYSLRCALSEGSLLKIMRRFDEHMGPESTSCITILICSPSIDVCRLGASRSSKLGPVNAAKGGGIAEGIPDVGIAPRDCKAAKSGLKCTQKKKKFLFRK